MSGAKLGDNIDDGNWDKLLEYFGQFVHICNAMVREIIDAAGSTFTLKFPNELIGKRVEIIAFAVGEQDESDDGISITSDGLKEIQAITRGALVDLSKYKNDDGTLSFKRIYDQGFY